MLDVCDSLKTTNIHNSNIVWWKYFRHAVPHPLMTCLKCGFDTLNTSRNIAPDGQDYLRYMKVCRKQRAKIQLFFHENYLKVWLWYSKFSMINGSSRTILLGQTNGNKNVRTLPRQYPTAFDGDKISRQPEIKKSRYCVVCWHFHSEKWLCNNCCLFCMLRLYGPLFTAEIPKRDFWY